MTEPASHAEGLSPLTAAPSLVLACLVSLAVAGCSAEDPPKLNVVLISLDTVRADHLGAHGYEARATSPNLDRLARSSWVFRRASATSNWTKPSVATYLTGLLPAQHGVYSMAFEEDGVLRGDVLPAATTTLAETYSSHGYASAAFVTNHNINRGTGFEQGFDTYVDKAGEARKILSRASDWLEKRDAERPFFLYLHFLDAHPPFQTAGRRPRELEVPPGAPNPYASDEWNAVRRAVNLGKLELEDEHLETLLIAYDTAIREMDRTLGRLFAKLEDLGLRENTVICVISDHGEEFLEKNRLGHGRGHDLLETLLHVTWILHVPGEGAKEIAVPCSLVDLYPTLLSASGLTTAAPPVPGGMDVSPDAEGRVGTDRWYHPLAARPVLAEHLDARGYQHSIRTGDTKVIRHLRSERRKGKNRGMTREDLAESYAGSSGGLAEFHVEEIWTYDLAAHPEELRTKNPRHELTANGRRLLGELLALRRWNSSDEAALTPQHVEALRSIGYAGEEPAE